METTERKKHKSGYELLKEKYAKLEKERDELKKKVAYLANGDAAYYRERDAYQRHLMEEYEPLLNEHREDKKRIAFLLDHCPFWVRWMYRKQFEKGEKN